MNIQYITDPPWWFDGWGDDIVVIVSGDKLPPPTGPQMYPGLFVQPDPVKMGW
jgi:hypothetical protein